MKTNVKEIFGTNVFNDVVMKERLPKAAYKKMKATIEAGAGGDVAKWLIIWAIPGAIIQFLGGSRQIGILFATGLLVGSTINGLTILIALLIRFVLVRRNKENEHTLNILGAGSLAGAALYSFFTATLALGKKK